MIILSEQDLVDLTQKVRPKAQARVLDFMGIPHRPRSDGSLVVLRIHVEVIDPGAKPSSRKRKREPKLLP